MYSWEVTWSLQCCGNLQDASSTFDDCVDGYGSWAVEVSESCLTLQLKYDECDHRSSLSLVVQIVAFQILDL